MKNELGNIELRLFKELLNSEEKHKNLTKFLNSKPNISTEEIDLLSQQEQIMGDYINILCERVALMAKLKKEKLS